MSVQNVQILEILLFLFNLLVIRRVEMMLQPIFDVANKRLCCIDFRLCGGSSPVRTPTVGGGLRPVEGGGRSNPGNGETMIGEVCTALAKAQPLRKDWQGLVGLWWA